MITSDAQQPMPVRVKQCVCLRVAISETFHDLSTLQIEICLGCAQLVRGSLPRALEILNSRIAAKYDFVRRLCLIGEEWANSNTL
jgi:hypothetical protein